MLQITIPTTELFDERTETFVVIPSLTLALEHSLLSISKWEAKWKIPFLSGDKKTAEQMLDYIRLMTVRPTNVPSIVYQLLKIEHMKAIEDYINDPMTATWFQKTEDDEGKAKPKNKRPITSELIYSWMAMLGIDWSCEKWHVNRLFVLIQCIEEQQKPPKKLSQAEIRARNSKLNAMRRKAMHTKG